MDKPLRCRLRLHKYTWYGMRSGGHPGDPGTYVACRRCSKRKGLLGIAAAHDLSYSGMDDDTQKANPSPPPDLWTGGF